VVCEGKCGPPWLFSDWGYHVIWDITNPLFKIKIQQKSDDVGQSFYDALVPLVLANLRELFNGADILKV
jgi:hypothetical protein